MNLYMDCRLSHIHKHTISKHSNCANENARGHTAWDRGLFPMSEPHEEGPLPPHQYTQTSKHITTITNISQCPWGWTSFHFPLQIQFHFLSLSPLSLSSFFPYTSFLFSLLSLTLFLSLYIPFHFLSAPFLSLFLPFYISIPLMSRWTSFPFDVVSIWCGRLGQECRRFVYDEPMLKLDDCMIGWSSVILKCVSDL